MEFKNFVSLEEGVNHIEELSKNSKDYSGSLFRIAILEFLNYNDPTMPRKCLLGSENNSLMDNWIESKGFELSDEEVFDYTFNRRRLIKRRNIDEWKVDYTAKLIIKWWNDGFKDPQIFKFTIITPSTNESIYIIEDEDKFHLEKVSKELEEIRLKEEENINE